MTALTFVIASLAVFRISHAVAVEDGPGDLFARWRTWVGQTTWIGRGFHCLLCVSVYVALIVVVLLVATGTAVWQDVWLLWPGLSGATLLYQKWSWK